MDDVEVAVVPAAGFGTRVLPASKVVSKELFPLYNKPAIHYIALECLLSGIKEIILVLSRRKMDILRYFEPDEELENFLRRKGKTRLIEEISELRRLKIDYVIQEEQLGLGHAILCAKERVGRRNFAVLLPDDIYVVKGEGLTAIKNIIKFFEEKRPSGGVVLVKRVPPEDVGKYGVISPVKREGKLVWFSGVVEKPDPAEAPSRYAVVGRYVFSTTIFDWIEKETFDESGEIQLAGAISRFSISDRNSFLACEIPGTWLDIGSPEGYMKAFKEISKLQGVLESILDALRETG